MDNWRSLEENGERDEGTGTEQGSEKVHLYVGNLDTRESNASTSLADVLAPYGRCDQIEMKNGFAFVWFIGDHSRAISELVGTNVNGRTFRMEYARDSGRKDGGRKIEPTNRLFTVNFDPVATSESDLEATFTTFGKVVSVEKRENFAFINFETVEQATAAKNELDGTMLGDRKLTVEFSDRHLRGGDRAAAVVAGFGFGGDSRRRPIGGPGGNGGGYDRRRDRNAPYASEMEGGGARSRYSGHDKDIFMEGFRAGIEASKDMYRSGGSGERGGFSRDRDYNRSYDRGDRNGPRDPPPPHSPPRGGSYGRDDRRGGW